MSLSDDIEAYLMQQLNGSADGVVEIQRNALSEMFGCSPSQINYVLGTRFTAARGFLVESRRGGAGYVRLVRLACPRRVIDLLAQHVGDRIDQDRALHLVLRLLESGFLTHREAAMLAAAVDRRCLAVPLPERDRLRARLVKAMILTLFRQDQGEQAARG